MRQLTILAVVLCTLVAQPVLAGEKTLLSAGTETPTYGEARPSRDLVRVVLTAVQKDEVKALDDCLAEQGFRRGDYASLLSAVRIDAAGGRKLWFVRPALKPYCFALYGAHLFRYFWLEEHQAANRPRYRLLFQNGGDVFAVYRQQHHGLNDIEATGCIVNRCRSARMSFDGRAYRSVLCADTTFGVGGRTVRTKRRCGPDQWENDQASGFNAPSER